MANQTGIDTLRAAVVDGRAESVRYRQNEVFRLHAALQQNSAAICAAIASERACSRSDSENELYFAMDAVRKMYESLDFDKAMKEEFLVKEGKDNLNKKVGRGLVAIRPTTHSRLYSILVPLTAAIIAGNCVTVEMDPSDSKVDHVLVETLRKSLDRDSFFASSKLSDDDLAQVDLLVDQNSDMELVTTPSLLSRPESRALAVVERTADVTLAAKAITTSRLSPHNTSPYSPDLVLVNTWITQDFVAACLKYAENFPASSSTEKLNNRSLLKEAEAKGVVKIYTSTLSGLSVVEVLDRSSPLLTQKLSGSTILILPCTSTTDLLNTQRSHASNSNLFLATYLFASPHLGKFLSEQLPSNISYINQLPIALLYGPASPSSPTSSSLKHELHPRYSPEMFSSSRPSVITKVEAPTEKEVKEAMGKTLKPTGQRPGHAVGFFEQGIFLGVGITLLLVLPSAGYGVFRVGREVWRLAGTRLK